MQINEITGHVVDAAMRVHSTLGPGLLESAYQVCLAHELGKRGVPVRREVLVPIRYDGIELDAGYRIDLLVDERVVVETKAVANIVAIHEAQLISHLKLGNYSIGLLINFNVVHLKDGIVRRAYSA